MDFDIKSGILHHEEGIDLMPANIELSVLETELISLYFGREKILRTYLNRLKENYDYIIIDCMPSLNLITINALVAADTLIVPLQCEYPCTVLFCKGSGAAASDNKLHYCQ